MGVIWVEVGTQRHEPSIPKTLWLCSLQRKTAHCAADGKEPGGAIIASRAAGAGEGASAGVYGAAPRGGSQGNRAV